MKIYLLACIGFLGPCGVFASMGGAAHEEGAPEDPTELKYTGHKPDDRKGLRTATKCNLYKFKECPALDFLDWLSEIISNNQIALYCNETADEMTPENTLEPKLVALSITKEKAVWRSVPTKNFILHDISISEDRRQIRYSCLVKCSIEPSARS